MIQEIIAKNRKEKDQTVELPLLISNLIVKVLSQLNKGLTHITLICNTDKTIVFNKIMISSSIQTVRRLPATIYDSMIISMTSVWYRSVLSELKVGDVVLDVGIGTASALITCKDILLEKKISVVGLDYNSHYIEAASEAIEAAGLSDSVSVSCISVYDLEGLNELRKYLPDDKNKFDVAYFSGSFSLLPDPIDALRAVATVLEPLKIGGKNDSKLTDDNTVRVKVYITQTYQRRVLPMLRYIKPLIKYVTTIDFGQLVTEDEIKELWEREAETLEVIDHQIISGSIDNLLQAAYRTELVVKV